MRRQHPNTSQVGEILFGQEKRRIAKKDHARLNVKALRETERLVREAREAHEAASEKRDYPKLRKFENVSSRHLAGTVGMSEKRDYLRRGARDDVPKPAEVHAAKLKRLGFEQPTRAATPRKEPIPKDRGRLKARTEVDFVDRNKRIGEPQKRQILQPTQSQMREDFGTVPAYLSQRKAELRAEAEKRKAEAPDPDCPPGMNRMDEVERLDMLKILTEQRAALHVELGKMPLSLSNLRLVKKKEDLEHRLNELDKSLAVFQRPVVYIKAD